LQENEHCNITDISFDTYAFTDEVATIALLSACTRGHMQCLSASCPKAGFRCDAAAAPASADRRTFVLALIGNLICSWSNNESLFIYVLMILLRTDEASAAVVFATLNTTCARLDLIQRLAKIRVTDKVLAKRLMALIERFSESTKVRNELNHCMFINDTAGVITHTQSMRLMETRSNLRFGEIKALDESRLREMLLTTNEMTKINRDIWNLLPRLEAHVCGSSQPQSGPADAAQYWRLPTDDLVILANLFIESPTPTTREPCRWLISQDAAMDRMRACCWRRCGGILAGLVPA
jgi:hypothetical protein